ncbi:transcriptional regulator BetI [Pseudooceanicola sediminis]|uniref:HTH-type transcriptional regulator BetI n=1 Tax=Pseudooceanicola sediminis TaxID=2211117 RepID=A0A399J718_9RHOB|nr:transcriptional regulator BetI [Pseudooceanicola sediminis]KAA2311509.1 transcriptional regulator BetI [Puniceibacterium sp. HSS470]RII40049.1 transcriptional regulator BetI [Pseudooceanicola sediminis]|tara:strand:- start:124038 stop:124631 length:594 start_codon:yes stop_codon:yes gene_type:complete
MPKVGMEPVRKKALIHATIAEIGDAGTLDVTVSQIAKRAGMSSALAHHYFGSKEQMFLATMRYVMRDYGETVLANLARAKTPEERIRAITDSSFDSSQFEREVIAAWLNFYVRALRSDETRRLLQVYARRLQSNLMHDLKKLFDPETAAEIAQGLASLIDGFYVRSALQEAVPEHHRIKAMVNDYLNLWLERKNRGV